MNNYTKTVVSAVQAWTADQIKQSKPDWNQNDPNAVDYIKNRTHYERLETKLLVDNLTREDYENENHPQLTFVVGSLYTVIWNGITYSDLECWYDGEYRILGDPYQLPFYIDDDGGNDLYIESVDDEDYIVSIISVISDIKTIDPKYLPEGIGYDTRAEKIIFSAPLQNRTQIYNLIKLSNIIENINSTTNVSFNFPEYDFSVEKATVELSHSSFGELVIYCPEIGDVICVYFENQLIADEFFNEVFRENEDDINPLTPGLYTWDTPSNLSITLWNFSGELHTIDPQYLPDFQSDWNEVNPDSPKYIKNKPFYENLIPIIENLTFDDYDNNTYDSPTFITGETYTVIWNGQMYSNLLCWDSRGDHVIGNEPDTPSLPFWIDDNGGNNRLELDWIGKFENISIYQENDEEAKQIDEKFLPILLKQPSDKVLIDNQNIEAFNSKWVEFNEDLSFEINPKVKYTVIFDDVEYTDLIPWYDGDVYVIGSKDRWYGYSDYEIPFASNGIEFTTNEYYDSYNLTIIEHSVVNKIDPKYLPDNYNDNDSDNGNGNASGGVSSWNDLTDKPFYPPTIYYEWNEDTYYETKVAMPEGSYAGYLAKISDDSPSSDFFVGKYITIAANIEGETQIMSLPITSQFIISQNGYYILTEALYIINADSVDINGITLTKGIWCIDDWDASQTGGISYLYIQIHDQGKMLDESVIPNTIARTSDLEHYTYGTEDLTAGVSELATGMLYFVYE